MPKHKTTADGYRLLHEGQLALAEIEHNGVRVDKEYLDSAISDMEKRISLLEEEMRRDENVYPQWSRAYGEKMNLGSRDQLSKVLFNVMGKTPAALTASGKRAAVSEAVLEKIDEPMVQQFLQAEKLKKAMGTYLLGIRREMVETPLGWFVHPSYNLNTVTTFRSSCDHPNFQNIPVRNAEIGEVVRRCYIPRKGNYFVEIDYGQIEVRVAACYNRDPVLIKYVSDQTADMHLDMAAQIFILEKNLVTKPVRHIAKNKFVFPEFYGSVYFQCAPSIWDALVRQECKLKDSEITVIQHLASLGVTELGNCDPDHIKKFGTEPHTFVHHLKKVEDDFWQRRFRRYTQWKQEWYAQYQRTGGFMLKTGLAVNGQLSKNDVLNYAIQGDSYQVEMASFVEVNKRLKKARMKTKLVGQIHDSDQADVPPSELEAYLDVAVKVKTEWVTHKFPWIVVPLEVEVEVSEVGHSWFEKKVWVKKNGGWGPK